MVLRAKTFTDKLPRYAGNEAAQTEGLVDLATNENLLGPSALCLEAYAAAAKDLFRYPDSAHRKLKAALAERFGVPAERIACGAGSDELISLLVRLFAGPGDEVLFPEFSFIMFSRYALRTGSTPVAARTDGYRLLVDGLLERIGPQTSIVFIANPNNPTGAYIARDEVQRLAAGVPPHIPLVLDSAYAEYSADPDYTDGLDLIGDFPNLIVLRTFSKLYALASLRIGWCAAPSLLVDRMDRLRGPYNLTAPAQMAAIKAIYDFEHIEASRRHNAFWRERLTLQLSRLGFLVEPSGGNFITVNFKTLDRAASGYKALLDHGLLTRPLQDYAMPECIRITIGRDSDNERIAEAFQNMR